MYSHNLAIRSEWLRRRSSRRRDTQTASRNAWTFPWVSSTYGRCTVQSFDRFLYSTTVSTLGYSPTDSYGLGKPAVVGEGQFGSLTELRWCAFEAMGFEGLDPAEKKLQFGDTESAQTARLDLSSVVLLILTTVLQSRVAKRTTLTWTGFSPLDSLAPTRTTPQISTPS